MATVEQDVYDRLVEAYENENLKGAFILLSFKAPGEPRRNVLIKQYSPVIAPAEVAGHLEIAKQQILADEGLEEWKP